MRSAWAPTANNKAANAIVVEGVKTLVDTNVAAGKDLLAVAQTSFSKAKTDGVKAVAANPVAYLPEGKDRVVAAYTDSVAVVAYGAKVRVPEVWA